MKSNFISTDCTVRKSVIQHGNIAQKPTEGAVCELLIEEVSIQHLRPTNLDDLESQILTKNPQVTYTIDDGISKIDRQIERAIKWMGVNEKADISINTFTSDCPKIPIVIQFKATLIKFVAHKPIWEWTALEKYSRAFSLKEIAVKLIKEKCEHAFWGFSKAVKLLITLEPIEDLNLEEQLLKDINELRTSLYNNMAMCQLQSHNYEYTIDLCTKVLKRDENNVKALYRRGWAYGELKNTELALNDFQKAVHIAPNNMAAKRKLKLLIELKKQDDIRMNALIKKMFEA